jgi:hypothetical protein
MRDRVAVRLSNQYRDRVIVPASAGRECRDAFGPRSGPSWRSQQKFTGFCESSYSFAACEPFHDDPLACPPPEFGDLHDHLSMSGSALLSRRDKLSPLPLAPRASMSRPPGRGARSSCVAGVWLIGRRTAACCPLPRRPLWTQPRDGAVYGRTSCAGSARFESSTRESSRVGVAGDIEVAPVGVEARRSEVAHASDPGTSRASRKLRDVADAGVTRNRGELSVDSASRVTFLP